MSIDAATIASWARYKSTKPIEDDPEVRALERVRELIYIRLSERHREHVRPDAAERVAEAIAAAYEEGYNARRDEESDN
jgi:hypothetical protein